MKRGKKCCSTTVLPIFLTRLLFILWQSSLSLSEVQDSPVEEDMHVGICRLFGIQKLENSPGRQAVWAHREGWHFALHPQLQRPSSHRGGCVTGPTRLTSDASLLHSLLGSITLENTSYKTWDDSQTNLQSRAKQHHVIVSFDVKVFPDQSEYVTCSSQSQKIKMKYELLSCERSQRGFLSFCLFQYFGSWWAFELAEAALPTRTVQHRGDWGKAAEGRYRKH